jgi:hypothetical protein
VKDYEGSALQKKFLVACLPLACLCMPHLSALSTFGTGRRRQAQTGVPNTSRFLRQLLILLKLRFIQFQSNLSWSNQFAHPFCQARV